MKIRQLLNEAAGVTAAFAFGRFNPAHQGHIAVWKTVQNAGVKWYIGTNPSTIGPNDPLTFEQKSAWMETIYPPIQGHIAAEQSVVTLAAKIYKDLGGKEDATIAYVTDETDWAWSGKLLNQYNGVEGKHGYYKFAQIVHVPSPRVSSATALRDAARAGDKVAFYHASGTDPKLKVAGKTYFDTVKEACEKYPLPVKKAKKTEGTINESPTIDFIRGLISEFNTQMSGSPYYPMDYKNPGMRMWTRGDGSKYKDPGYIFIDRDLKPEDQPKWHKAKAVEKFWKFLESKGARKIGDVSGEFGSDPHSPAVVLNKLVFVFNGRSITWGSTSRLKNSNVWRQKQPAVAEASLATMRDYFAGDEEAKDPSKLAQIRDFYNKHKDDHTVDTKKFNSVASYIKWLERNKQTKIGGNVKETLEEEQLLEYLRKIHKRWAIVSKKEGRPLVYFKGEGKPSADWVERQERRIKRHSKKK